MRNQKGFAHWLIIILPVIIIVFTGFLVVSKSKSNTSGGQQGFFSRLTGGGGPSCSATSGLLKYSPVPLDKMSTVVPLGNFAPPGHVTPTPHMYYNYLVGLGNTPAKTDLVVPADMTITKLWLFDQGQTQPYKAYRLDFTICKQVTGYFILILNLPPKLAGLAKAPWDEDQQSNVGNGIQHNYWKTVSVKMTAGESLGSAGGFPGAPDGLDLGLYDTRVKFPTQANPERFPSPGGPLVCSLNYYNKDLSAKLYARLGGFDFVPRDPGEPKCGTVYQDVPGTGQGIWFSQGTSNDQSNNVDAQLTLGHWNLDHSKGVFSAGNNVKKIGINSSNIYLFTPQKTGKVNLDFNLMKTGTIYCYDTTVQSYSGDTSSAHLLVKLTDATHLSLANNGSACASGPWTMNQSLAYTR